MLEALFLVSFGMVLVFSLLHSIAFSSNIPLSIFFMLLEKVEGYDGML